MAKIPEFSSYEEEAEFWDTHSAADYLDDTVEVEPPPLFVRRDKNLIDLRLGSANMAKIRAVAARKGMSDRGLVRRWVMERLAQELLPEDEIAATIAESSVPEPQPDLAVSET
jgi:hypothetical protein